MTKHNTWCKNSTPLVWQKTTLNTKILLFDGLQLLFLRPFSVHELYLSSWCKFWSRRVHDPMVVGFTTTYAISAYHHWCCEFESQSGWGVQHYMIKFVSDLRQVSGFHGSSGFLHQYNWPPRYNWNIVESGIKHHQTKSKQILNTCHVRKFHLKINNV